MFMISVFFIKISSCLTSEMLEEVFESNMNITMSFSRQEKKKHLLLTLSN